jgi:murein DD-endopeptidase MepM/ murein hydrolase activator NlpD
MAELRDTIVTIDKREEQIRLLAGLPSPDSAVTPTAQLPLDIDRLIERANTLSASFATVSTTLSRNSERMSATPSIMPTTGWLSSEFSRARFHPILHLARPHEGIDLAAPYGTPVVAPAAGRVMRISHQTGYGLVLEIEHGNGIETKYAHLSRVVVQEGQRVIRGEPIAAVGNSGLSTGPHLHYEVHVNGKVVDPLTYVLPGAIPD